MFSKSFKTLPCRIIAVVLSAALVLTFMPFLGETASAAAKKEVKGISNLKLGASTNSSSTESVLKSFTVTKPDKNGIVTVNGDVSVFVEQNSVWQGVVFDSIYVDNKWVADINSPTIKGLKIYMKNYDVGYHTITTRFSMNGEVLTIDGQYFIDGKLKVPTNIYSKPSYKGVYEVYSRTLAIYPYKTLSTNNGGSLYLEYKAKGDKKWKRYGPMKCGAVKLALEQGWKVSGLKPNKTYYTRLRYGQYATYETDNGGDGKNYFFAGPVLKNTTIKTGKKNKPAIKSAKVKVYGVKYHKVRHSGGWFSDGYGNVYYQKPWTEKFYTYKIRVTVKLKKKTGAKGLWISSKFGSKFVKGNKKTYVAKFTPYPNYRTKRPPKGMGKATVAVRSYENKNWGGVSPVAKKKVKVK